MEVQDKEKIVKNIKRTDIQIKFLKIFCMIEIVLSVLVILRIVIYSKEEHGCALISGPDPSEVKAHNSQFLAYEGRHKGSEVKTLITMIRSNNKEYLERQIKIAVSYTTAKKDVPAPTNIDTGEKRRSTDVNTAEEYKDWNDNIKNTTTYYVTFRTGDNGCINGIEIHVYSDRDR